MPDFMNEPVVVIGLFLLQGLWGLFLVVLTWSMRRVLNDIKENTTATTKLGEGINAIHLLLAGHYATKTDVDKIDDRLRELEKDMVRMESRNRHGDS